MMDCDMYLSRFCVDDFSCPGSVTECSSCPYNVPWCENCILWHTDKCSGYDEMDAED